MDPWASSKLAPNLVKPCHLALDKPTDYSKYYSQCKQLVSLFSPARSAVINGYPASLVTYLPSAPSVRIRAGIGIKSVRNYAAQKVKARAKWQCETCGSDELLQAHHQRDGGLIALCARCHSKQHPRVPERLFFTQTHQPYWFNIPAARLAREIGCHPQTVIRWARRLGISIGFLKPEDAELLRGKKRPPRKVKPQFPRSPLKTLIKFRTSRGIIVPATWLRYHARRLGATILEVEIHEVGDDLVIKALPHAAATEGGQQCQ